LLAALAACGGDGRPALTVVAAADLRHALDEVAAGFERSCGCEVRLSYGSTGLIDAQVRAGLPADVFLAADAETPSALEADGLLLPNTRVAYAIGRLAVAAPARSAAPPADLPALAAAGVSRVAIANPAHAPYGRAARQALQRAGVWDALQDRLVVAENAAQAAAYVESGDAGAGVIPLSLALRLGMSVIYTALDPALHDPIRQEGGVLARAARPDLAAAFLAYLTGPEGAAVLARYGYTLPGFGTR
jgi:molybdate transport system substrate-binding protein